MRIILSMLFSVVAFAQQPVVVELFTSEGCSSCPPADKLLSELDQKQPVAGAQIIVLSEHVDYWNSLGWADPFSSPQFTERQNQYVRRLNVADPYTPQAVIDGRFEAVGGNSARVVAAIQRAAEQTKTPVTLEATRDGDQLQVKLQTAAKKGVLSIVIAERQMESHVSAGENAGHLLSHTSIVRSITRLGGVPADGGLEKDLKLEKRWGAKGLRVVALLTNEKSGAVEGAAVIECAK